MRNKNLIRGALILILGGAFLFILANIFGVHTPRFEVDDMPQELSNPRPYAKNNFAIRLPLARRIVGFLFLTAFRRHPFPLLRRA